MEHVFSNLSQARDAGCRFVDFTGGEPLLHPQLPQFLHEAKRLGYITSVTTNCTLFKKRAAELRGKIDLLHFSLDADSAAIHDAIRGVPSFDSVMESIDIALEHDLVPDLLFTYTDENLAFFEGVYKLAREKRLLVILDPVFSVGGGDSLKPEIHKKALSLSKKKGVYLNRAHLFLRSKGGNNKNKPICRAVSSTIVLLPHNTLALPCFHQCNTELPIDKNLGDCLKSTQWNNAQREQGRYDFCNGCHINCYMDPSFNYHPLSFMPLSLADKLKYSYTKYLSYSRPVPLKKSTKHK